MPATSAPAARLNPDAIYHLKIVLIDVAPTIWRRFQVPASMTLASLHRTIQIVMGWEDFHLHQFHIAGETYGPSELECVKDERRPLGELVPALQPQRSQVSRPVGNVRSVFHYEYDMGDMWQHEIRVEKVMRPNPLHRYPRCFAGAWEAPPEDCGGPDGYRELDRRRKNVFDVEEVNEELRDAFALEREPDPPAPLTPRKQTTKATPRRKKTGDDSPTASDKTLPEPFKTLARAQEGRATLEQELAALVDFNGLLDWLVDAAQSDLHTSRSAKKQAFAAKAIARGRKAGENLDQRIAILREKLGLDPTE